MLTRVTITGADDGVDHVALADLSKTYPFVEWGILFSDKRTGTPRYPSRDWTDTLRAIASRMHLSAHLCGSQARDTLAGDDRALRHARDFDRVQLNGFSSGSASLAFARLCRRSGRAFILQTRSELDFLAAAEDVTLIATGRVSALFDPSGGRGISVKTWPKPPKGLHVGYAGGIKPDNVLAILESIESTSPIDAPFWIDMESGVRDVDDRFDLGRVREVLARVAPHVAEGDVG